MKLFSILESNVYEALELSVAKNYAEYIRRPETEKVVDNIMAKLKQQGTFTGKESKRGERIYFDYDNSDGEKPEKFRSPTMDGIELTLQNNADVFKELFGKTYSLEGGKDYLDNLVTDSKGQKVGIGKLFNMSIEKLKKKGDEESFKLVQRFEYNRRAFQEDQARNNAISRKNKKTYIVISKANYDIAGMTTGRSWSSCMSLTSGNGQKYIHCDIKEGTLIAYLVDGDDINIQRPIARLLIKPFVSLDKYKDYLYVVGDTYGTAPGFSEVVKKMFKEAQPDKAGTYKINQKLYPDSLPGEITVEKKVKVLDKTMLDKFVEDQDNKYSLSINGNSLKYFFSTDPTAIEVISGIENSKDINISSHGRYSGLYEDSNLDNLVEVSNVKTSGGLYLEDLPNLKKISNISSQHIEIEEGLNGLNNLELIENINCEGSLQIETENLKKLKKISGTVNTIRINQEFDQEFFDNLDLNELIVEEFFTIKNFSGISLNKLLSSVNVKRAIFLDKCDNLKEIPQNIKKGDNGVTLFLPKELKGKIKIPENINYRVAFRDE